MNLGWCRLYARWLRFWYVRASVPYEMRSLMARLFPLPVSGCVRQMGGFRMRLDPRDLLQVNYLLDGTWDPATSHVILRFAPSSQVIFDVGAHVGYFSLLAQSVAPPSARIYAFEPNPYAQRQFLENVALNGFDNIVLEPVAAGCTSGALTFHVREKFEPGASSHYPVQYATQKLEVPVVRLDDYRRDRGIQSVDLVKIDVEGAEIEVLEGMEGGLREGCYGIIIVELHPHLWTDRDQTIQFLWSLRDPGYELFEATESDIVPLAPGSLPKSLMLLYVPSSRGQYAQRRA